MVAGTIWAMTRDDDLISAAVRRGVIDAGDLTGGVEADDLFDDWADVAPVEDDITGVVYASDAWVNNYTNLVEDDLDDDSRPALPRTGEAFIDWADRVISDASYWACDTPTVTVGDATIQVFSFVLFGVPALGFVNDNNGLHIIEYLP